MSKRRTLWAIEYMEPGWRVWKLHPEGHQNVTRGQALGELQELRFMDEMGKRTAFRVVRYEPTR